MQQNSGRTKSAWYWNEIAESKKAMVRGVKDN